MAVRRDQTLLSGGIPRSLALPRTVGPYSCGYGDCGGVVPENILISGRHLILVLGITPRHKHHSLVETCVCVRSFPLIATLPLLFPQNCTSVEFGMSYHRSASSLTASVFCLCCILPDTFFWLWG